MANIIKVEKKASGTQFCFLNSSITLPDTITYISDKAFAGCTSLTDITIGDGVIQIPASAFYNTGYYNDFGNWDNDVLYRKSFDMYQRNYRRKLQNKGRNFNHFRRCI